MSNHDFDPNCPVCQALDYVHTLGRVLANLSYAMGQARLTARSTLKYWDEENAKSVASRDAMILLKLTAGLLKVDDPGVEETRERMREMTSILDAAAAAARAAETSDPVLH